MKKILLSCALLFASLFSIYAAAHNVVGGVYATGFEIEGEAGFSNGSMANAGTIVKITDQAGIPLGEVLTDDEGFFTFIAKKRITHVFKINMGAGHQLTMQLPAEELPESLSAGSSSIQSTNNPSQSVSNETPVIANQTTSLMLEKAIAKQIKPLRQEIQKLERKVGLT